LEYCCDVLQDSQPKTLNLATLYAEVLSEVAKTYIPPRATVEELCEIMYYALGGEDPLSSKYCFYIAKLICSVVNKFLKEGVLHYTQNKRVVVPFVILDFWVGELPKKYKFLSQFLNVEQLLDATLFEKFISKFYAFKQSM
jgi:hypothetical protein